MDFKSGYTFGYMAALFLGYIVLPLFIFLGVVGYIEMLLMQLGFSPSNAENIALAIGIGLTAYLFYVLLTRKNRNQKGIGETTATNSTGARIKNSVFTLETTSREIKQIHITNPYRGILILGGAGAGKSKSFIEPIIVQSIQQGFAGLLYDFKFPTLAEVAQKAIEYHKSTLRSFYVNFDDLSRSHRVNPLHPSTMPTSSYADEYARTIIANLIPESIKNPSFFSDSAQGYLSAIIWFLREEYPQYCTLPHAMALANSDALAVVNLLSTNAETSGTVANIREALMRNAGGQSAAVIGTLQNALRKINNRQIVWVLSGNDFSLNINDPHDPKFVTVGNNPTLSSAYGPVLALLATVAIKQMNQQDKTPSTVILDEAPTLFIPNFDSLPATGRSNKVATVYGAQDISQIEDMYGRSKKDSLIANLNNQFYGRVGHSGTAQYITELWGKEDVQAISRGTSEQLSSFGSSSESKNVSWTERNRIKVQDVLGLQPGEFLGQLVESDYSSFRAQIKPANIGPLLPLPVLKNVTDEQLKENFKRVQLEAASILDKPADKESKASLPDDF